MSETGNNADIWRRWFEEVWNQGRGEVIDELAAPNIVAHGLVDSKGQPITSRDAFKEFWQNFRDAFPDINVTVEDVISEGDKAMARCTVRATHGGHGLGVPPTQKPILFSGVAIARIKEGQFFEVWNYFDFISLYQQLGMLPAKFA